MSHNQPRRPCGLGEKGAEQRFGRYRTHRARAAAGQEWVDTGFVFTRPDGTHLHLAWASGWFKQLAREAGLPPIRLHDLRFGIRVNQGRVEAL
ncbi:hypothetical protein ABH935_007118 [Catenulispora sp. GAS73]